MGDLAANVIRYAKEPPQYLLSPSLLSHKKAGIVAGSFE
jgi:hypothetical protein